MCYSLPTMRIIRTGVLCGIAGVLVGSLAQPARKAAKQFLNLDGQKPPGYTHVVTSPAGRMIFISGRAAAGTDFTTQATATFEDLKRCLAMAGAGFKDVVKINYFIADMANTGELRRVRARYLDMEHPPAATLVQTGLAKGLMLEVEAVAIVPERRH